MSAGPTPKCFCGRRVVAGRRWEVRRLTVPDTLPFPNELLCAEHHVEWLREHFDHALGTATLTADAYPKELTPAYANPPWNSDAPGDVLADMKRAIEKIRNAVTPRPVNPLDLRIEVQAVLAATGCPPHLLDEVTLGCLDVAKVYESDPIAVAKRIGAIFVGRCRNTGRGDVDDILQAARAAVLSW